MIVHHAAWVVPIDTPPIRNGWVAVERGLIVALGGPKSPIPQFPNSPIPQSTSWVILPGLVNAHVHLELSWMRGAVPPSSSMPAWASQLLTLRRNALEEPIPPMEAAIAEARASGTALVGEVTNTLATYALLAGSALAAAVFYEQLGFRRSEARARAAAAQERIEALTPNRRLRVSVVPHAPYSVSPELLRAIGRLSASGPTSIHLAESAEELQFLKDGTGAWRALLDALGVWDEDWHPPGCGPVEFLEQVGLLDARLLAVHGVQLTDADLTRLAGANATIVACPRSNKWTGAGTPPLERFYNSGVRVAIGTDSLASVDTLNMFEEIAAVRSAAPGVPASRVLESATRSGADALGFGAELGTIAPGKRAELLAVRLPADVADVEEYLVSGVGPADIRWLAAD